MFLKEILTKYDALRKLHLFFNADEHLLKDLIPHCHFKTYQEDEIIYYEGEESHYVFGVIKGSVILYSTNLKQEVVPKRSVFCGEIFGLINNIQNRPYFFNAKTLRETLVVKISFNALKQHMSTPPLSDKLIKMLAYTIQNQMTLSKLDDLNATQKVAYTLLHFPQRFFKKKKYLLAKELKMSPETLSRVLSKLKNDDIICYCDKSIRVLNKEELETLL